MSDTLFVVGAGTMGCGIAAYFAKGGCEVTVHDSVRDARAAAKSRIADILLGLARTGILSAPDAELTLQRVHVSEDLQAVSESSLVIESIPENLEWKRALFERLDCLAPPETVLATNTSSFSPAAIGEGLAHAERLLATHFYYPAELMPLVEMVAGPFTAEWAMDETARFLTDHGKCVVVCRDSPGYIGSRIQMAMILEAITILEEGTASAADIDNAVRTSFGPRLAVMGPLETVDRAGLDIYLKASQTYYGAYGRDTFRPPHLLAEKVARGELGVKSGHGLHGATAGLDRVNRYEQLAGLLRHMGLVASAGEEGCGGGKAANDE
jgi:3-hydroxybutyryl-CoA dehydrogenase